MKLLISLLLFYSTVAHAVPQRIIEEAVNTGSDSLIIWRDGNIIHQDKFGNGDRLQSMQSVTKSVAAILIYRLIDEGKISSDNELASRWYPEWKNDEQKSKITLKMLMNHTSGLQNIAVNRDTDIIAESRKVQVESIPGAKFNYNNLAVNLLGYVISQTSGMLTKSFANKIIFAPLNIKKWDLLEDINGNSFMAGGLYLRPIDMLPIGIMMLGGKYNGQQIISEKSIRELTTKSQGFDDCGLLWWLRAYQDKAGYFRAFSAEGYGGQYIAVNPELKIVGIRTRDPYLNPTVSEALMERNFWQFPHWIGEWE